jgi:YVTN family beta-propeller protein
MAVSPDGSRAYVANYGSKTVSAIDTATNTVVSAIAVGGYPTEVQVSPDGNFVYVTNTYDRTVSVIYTGI